MTVGRRVTSDVEAMFRARWEPMRRMIRVGVGVLVVVYAFVLGFWVCYKYF